MQVLEADLDQQGKLVEPLLERIQALMDEQLDLEDWCVYRTTALLRIVPAQHKTF